MDNGIKYGLFSLAASILICSLLISYPLHQISKRNYIDSGYLGNMILELANAVKSNDVTISQTNSLTLAEASTYLRIPETNLIDLVNRKESKIPYFKVGNEIYFSKKELSAWVDYLAANRISW
ncbi:helix-turn-helix domain-containing protein [Brevibacillus dissolubilis]|uniref:helix-turn-helix domain-containing protein n=1 Tax=Brevibacillus dissolubilis TaxID=1844116 RepID=UPI00111698BC|nr:helix-turn-helix domain-containing protein [Brevibacillus dissolubilis]